MFGVHMLWVSGPLSRLARLGLASFLARGFIVTLWTYDKLSVGDSGAQLADAAEIIPPHGDYRNLSNLFRYKILALKGGIWADTDIVAQSVQSNLPTAPFIASEKRRPFRHREASATGESLTQVTNCFMACPGKENGDFWHCAASVVESMVPTKRTWENSGPNLLTSLMLKTPAHGVTILPPESVNPVAWWNVPSYFLDDRDPPSSPFLHLYASIWAKRGIDPGAPFPPGSLAGRLWRSHGL